MLSASTFTLKDILGNSVELHPVSFTSARSVRLSTMRLFVCQVEGLNERIHGVVYRNECLTAPSPLAGWTSRFCINSEFPHIPPPLSVRARARVCFTILGRSSTLYQTNIISLIYYIHHTCTFTEKHLSRDLSAKIQNTRVFIELKYLLSNSPILKSYMHTLCQ